MPPLLAQFVHDHQGETGFGDTPENSGQCVGLCERWTDILNAPHIWGNACDLAVNASRSAYVVTANGPANYPSPGDIVTFPVGWGGSSVGHCGVVTAADANSFTLFEQNDRIGGGNGACRLWHFTRYYDGMMWIHPKALDPAPPVVSPIPDPPAPVVSVEIVPPVDPPVPTPVPVIPVVPTPGDISITVTTGQPEYVSSYVGFPGGPQIKTLTEDAAAIDMTAQGAPKRFEAGQKLRLGGTFEDQGKTYYRGTSGDWYGIATEAFNLPARTDTAKALGFWALLMADPIGAFIRLFARNRK